MKKVEVLGKGTVKERFTVTISPEVRQRLKAEAKAVNRSVSNYIEILLKEKFKIK